MEFLSRKSTEYIFKLLLVVGVLIILNLLLRYTIFRIDFTEENRYTISSSTRALLGDLEEELYVEVYLGGDINAEFNRLQEQIKATLKQFQPYAKVPIRYNFIDPDQAASKKSRNEYYQYLVNKGIQPTTVFDNVDGKKTQKLIFPAAELNYQGKTSIALLLSGNNTSGAAEAINQSIENIEYQLASAIQKLSSTEKKKVAFVTDSSISGSPRLSSVKQQLKQSYDVEEVNSLQELDKYEASIFVKPSQPYTTSELYRLDQYIMKGGKALFFIDGISVAVDSIREYGAMALPSNHNLQELLFQYGVRVNKDLLQDVNSGNFPIVTGSMGKDPQIQLLPWPYYVILNNYADHPIVKNMNAVYGKFVSSIDTLSNSPKVKKTPLLFSSEYSRTVNGPVYLSFDRLKEDLDPSKFTQKNIPVAYLLEGEIPSAYKNRLAPKGFDSSNKIKASEAGKILVVGDGDLLLSEINRQNGKPFELGTDPYARHPVPFSNAQLLENMLSYLLNEDGLIVARNKDLKIRPLDKVKVENSKVLLQVINIAAPVLLIIVFGIIRHFWRKRKYATR